MPRITNEEIVGLLKRRPTKFFARREIMTHFGETCRQKVQQHVQRLITQGRVEFKIGERNAYLIRCRQ